jgi:hypothetical protein
VNCRMECSAVQWNGGCSHFKNFSHVFVQEGINLLILGIFRQFEKVNQTHHKLLIDSNIRWQQLELHLNKMINTISIYCKIQGLFRCNRIFVGEQSTAAYLFKQRDGAQSFSHVLRNSHCNKRHVVWGTRCFAKYNFVLSA